MGAWDNSKMRIEGEDEGFDGVWKGTEFLQKRELGIKVDLAGKNVVVVGGGNTAMDACRSSLRMGAERVVCLYRRTRKEMPANDFEIEASIHEGVEYHFLAAPTKIMADENKVLRQIEYIKMELGEPDSSGRRRPVPIEGSEEVMDVDVVIAAIGQRPLDDFYTDDLKEKGLKLTRWNSIEADPETLQTDVPHIFTCGDVWTGPGLLVDAIGNGRQAARSIHLFLNGEDMRFPEGTMYKPARLPESGEVAVEGIHKKPRVAQPELDAKERIKSFDEVDLVVTPELMKVEADRCLRCGTLCYNQEAGEKEKRLIEKIGLSEGAVGAMETLEKILRESP
jgi:NADPH-dependent glutamate synthase beta subunit-like oxidoreductase